METKTKIKSERCAESKHYTQTERRVRERGSQGVEGSESDRQTRGREREREGRAKKEKEVKGKGEDRRGNHVWLGVTKPWNNLDKRE